MFAPVTVPHDAILGQFVVPETGKTFEYVASDREWVAAWEYPMQVFVGPDYQKRYARVLGSVAYVLVDEDENGPVVEKWTIRHNWRKAA